VRVAGVLHPCAADPVGYTLRHDETPASRNSSGWIRLFEGRQSTAKVNVWAIRRCLMFAISYRDLALMLMDRGVEVDRTTIFRWIGSKLTRLNWESDPPSPADEQMTPGRWMRMCRGKRRTRWGPPPATGLQEQLQTTVSGTGQKPGS
jgi:hypothetical protein